MELCTKFILDKSGNPIPVMDVMEWARWFETYERHVALTEVKGKYRVSTVFLGLDHSFVYDPDPLTHRPVLWETMVFGGPLDQEQERYDSLEDALKGHAEMVERCEAAQGVAGGAL